MSTCSRMDAQYFLLTPKLLPDLHYETGVTVLIVHNSDTMCSYDQWNLDKMIRSLELEDNEIS